MQISLSLRDGMPKDSSVTLYSWKLDRICCSDLRTGFSILACDLPLLRSLIYCLSRNIPVIFLLYHFLQQIAHHETYVVL